MATICFGLCIITLVLRRRRTNSEAKDVLPDQEFQEKNVCTNKFEDKCKTAMQVTHIYPYPGEIESCDEVSVSLEDDTFLSSLETLDSGGENTDSDYFTL